MTQETLIWIKFDSAKFSNSAPTKLSNFRRNDMVINGTTILRCLSLLVQNPPDEKESHKTTLFWGGNKV